MDKFYSLLGLGKKARYLVSGETACIQDIKKNKCKLLIIAKDASENTKEKFVNLSNKRNVKCVLFGNKESLGKAIGKEITALISINDSNFSMAILKLLS